MTRCGRLYPCSAFAGEPADPSNQSQGLPPGQPVLRTPLEVGCPSEMQSLMGASVAGWLQEVGQGDAVVTGEVLIPWGDSTLQSTSSPPCYKPPGYGSPSSTPLSLFCYPLLGTSASAHGHPPSPPSTWPRAQRGREGTGGAEPSAGHGSTSGQVVPGEGGFEGEDGPAAKFCNRPLGFTASFALCGPGQAAAPAVKCEL